MDLEIAGVLKVSLSPKRVWLVSQVELSNCTKRQVIDLANVYMPIISLSSKVSYKQLNLPQICSVKVQ